MTFISFDSLEDAHRYMRRQEALAQAAQAVQPWQHAIGRGQYWVQPYEDLLIFGYCLTEEEIEASERDAGSDDEELDYTTRTLRNSYGRGYLWGQCYSTVEPEGEWGSTHRSVVLPLSRELFERAKAAGWRADDELLRAMATHCEQVCRG